MIFFLVLVENFRLLNAAWRQYLHSCQWLLTTFKTTSPVAFIIRSNPPFALVYPWVDTLLSLALPGQIRVAAIEKKVARALRLVLFFW